MSLFRFLPGHRDCRGIMHVKDQTSNEIMEIKCKLHLGHEGPHLGYVHGGMRQFENNPARWFNSVDHEVNLSKRFDNPGANSATGMNGRKVFIMGPGNSLKKK